LWRLEHYSTQRFLDPSDPWGTVGSVVERLFRIRHKGNDLESNEGIEELYLMFVFLIDTL
jgi:hypothetical protein